jgi:hypothetical protein
VEPKQISQRKRTPMHARLPKANRLHVGSTSNIRFTWMVRVTGLRSQIEVEGEC